MQPVHFWFQLDEALVRHLQTHRIEIKTIIFSFSVFIDTGSIKPTWIGLCKLFIKILAAVVFQGSDYHFLAIKRLLCSYSPLIDRYFKKVKKYTDEIIKVYVLTAYVLEEPDSLNLGRHLFVCRSVISAEDAKSLRTALK